MNLYVDPSMKELKLELIINGYNIIENYNINECDIILCDLKTDNSNYINKNLIKQPHNIIIIDAAYKNLKDIENILLNRV